MMDRLHQAFRRSQNQLVSVLENRKAEVKARRLRKTFVFFFFFLPGQTKYENCAEGVKLNIRLVCFVPTGHLREE